MFKQTNKHNIYSLLFSSLLFSSLLFYSILFYSILFYSILFYSILFYSILFYSILFYSILFYSILFYSILFYSILFYSILFYSILFYSIYQFYFLILLNSDEEGEEVIASIKHFQSLGVDINKKNNKGKSALCYCAYNNCHFFLKFVELGGDLTVVDNHGRFILDLFFFFFFRFSLLTHHTEISFM